VYAGTPSRKVIFHKDLDTDLMSEVIFRTQHLDGQYVLSESKRVFFNTGEMCIELPFGNTEPPLLPFHYYCWSDNKSLELLKERLNRLTMLPTLFGVQLRTPLNRREESAMTKAFFDKLKQSAAGKPFNNKFEALEIPESSGSYERADDFAFSRKLKILEIYGRFATIAFVGDKVAVINSLLWEGDWYRTDWKVVQPFVSSLLTTTRVTYNFAAETPDASGDVGSTALSSTHSKSYSRATSLPAQSSNRQRSVDQKLSQLSLSSGNSPSSVVDIGSRKRSTSFDQKLAAGDVGSTALSSTHSKSYSRATSQPTQSSNRQPPSASLLAKRLWKDMDIWNHEWKSPGLRKRSRLGKRFGHVSGSDGLIKRLR